MPIKEAELIELIDQTFEEFYQKEGRRKVNAAHSTLIEIARHLANNEENQYITYKRLTELMEGEENTDTFQRYKKYVKVMKENKKKN